MGAHLNKANANAAVQQQRIESNVLTGEQRLVPVTQPTVTKAPVPTKKPSTSTSLRRVRHGRSSGEPSTRRRPGIDLGPGRANRIPDQGSPSAAGVGGDSAFEREKAGNQREYEQLLQRIRNINQGQ